MLSIGIIKEGKIPADSRVPLTPKQCQIIKQQFGINVFIQSSPKRSYKDEEYLRHGVPVVEDVQHCSILMGVKEVPIDQLIPDKTYFFFSHTIKKQPHNRKLLQAILAKNIRLIDYEVLTDDNGNRLIAFGKFAGIVGAHNGLWTYAQRTNSFSVKRMKDLHDYAEGIAQYKGIKLPLIKIVLTGTGRVATGAKMFLQDIGIQEVNSEDYLSKTFNFPVFTQLDCSEYVERIDGSTYNKQDFYEFPEKYKSSFTPYTKVTNIMINGIYWDSRSPAFFTLEDMRKPDFKIKTIADVTCDIAPSSIPSTIKANTIDEPVYGFDPFTENIATAYQANVVDMMTIDYLPNELPRDASQFFGEQFICNILPELIKFDALGSDVIEGATVTNKGKLTPNFSYLSDFVVKQNSTPTS